MHILGVHNPPRIFFSRGDHSALHRSLFGLHLWHLRTSPAIACFQIAVCTFFTAKCAVTRCYCATCVRESIMHDRHYPYASTYAYSKLHFDLQEAVPPRLYWLAANVSRRTSLTTSLLPFYPRRSISAGWLCQMHTSEKISDFSRSPALTNHTALLAERTMAVSVTLCC